MPRNDCTIRALSLVTDLDYAAVVELLTPDGYRPGKGFWLDRWIACRMEPAIGEPESIAGWWASWFPCPAVKGQKRLTATTFASAYPAGRYILRQSHHSTAVIDGRVVMEDRHATACVYGAWHFTKDRPDA